MGKTTSGKQINSKLENKARRSRWSNLSHQYIRLLSELNAVGLTTKQMNQLMLSMDLKKEDIQELLNFAEEDFEKIKY